MKKIVTLVLGLLTVSTLIAQAPQMFSYQAVVRNSTEDLVQTSPVGVKISILEDGTTGSVVYEETHTPTTNTNGLFTIEVGSGTLVSGDFATINWGEHDYYLQTEVDPDGGTTYTISGTSQLLSVPYALHANSSDTSNVAVSALSAPADNDWTEGSGTVYNTTDNVGIGTSSPGASLHVEGDLKLITGNEGEDKVLSSDANGNADWKYAMTPMKAGTVGTFYIQPGSDYTYYQLMSITPEQSGVIQIHVNGNYYGNNNVDQFGEIGYQITLGNSAPNGFTFNKSQYLGKSSSTTSSGTFYEVWSVLGTYNVVAGITYYIWVGGKDWGSASGYGAAVKRVNGVVTLHTTNGL